MVLGLVWTRLWILFTADVGMDEAKGDVGQGRSSWIVAWPRNLFYELIKLHFKLIGFMVYFCLCCPSWEAVQEDGVL